MYFGYPVAATQNNWLHECLCEAVRNVHALADAGRRFPPWPQVLPEARRTQLRRRTGLRDCVKVYHRAIRTLPKCDRDDVLEALAAENRISDLLAGTHDCARFDDLPPVVRGPVSELFSFAFDMLTDLGVRDEQYEAIDAVVPEHTCPFCGTDRFDPPGAPREPMDHYLARSQYPFAAANLRNLVPMCRRCNSAYKLATDMLRGANGSHRVAFDPYAHTGVSLSLDDSEPFDGATANTPNWAIRFSPDTPETATWDDVFSVRTRYRRDHLDRSFPRWLGLFGSWARGSGLQIDTEDALVAAIQRYEEFWARAGMQDRAFLQAAVFRMLRVRCQSGNRRLLRQLRELIALGQ